MKGLLRMRMILVSHSFPVFCAKRTLAFHPSQTLSHLRAGSIARAMAATFEPALARQPAAEHLAPAPHGASKYKVAVCQLSIVADKAVNIAHAKEVIEVAADKGAQLIVLPEMWNCPYSNDSFPIYAEEADGSGSATPSSSMLSDVAQKKGVTLIGGSIPERCNGRLYNTCYIFGKNGELKGKHRKVHLFDIDIPGSITFKESETLTPGEGLTVVDTDVGRIGVGICYDIRFPEMAMLYATRGVHMIAYPGAFNMTTGPLHWELLQKARYANGRVCLVGLLKVSSASQESPNKKVLVEGIQHLAFLSSNLTQCRGQVFTASYVRKVASLPSDFFFGVSCDGYHKKYWLGYIRAVDNQVYVITCSPARDTSAGYIAWGHSTIVGPFGEIVATTADAEATIFGEIDYAQIHQRRLNMPLENQRRGDLYSLLDKSRN